MLARRRGRILNLASTASFQPGPLMAVYYATKAYVLSFSEALANETAGTGVTVTALCPGPTVTEFGKQAGAGETRLFHSPLVRDARTVALAGYRGMMRGQRVVIPGFGNWLLAEAIRFTPRRLVDGDRAPHPGDAEELSVRMRAGATVGGLAALVFLGATSAPDPPALRNDLLVAVSPVRPPAAASPATAEILKDVAVSAITYASDGLKVKGYLAVPKQGDHLPAVIFNRGGNRAFGAITDEQAISRLGGIARWGYVVAASQYRGNEGGEGKEEFGGADVDDVLNLIPLLESIPKVDATRIGMFGWSRGGMMTYLALTRTDRFAAAIVGSGVSDLSDMLARRPEMEDVFRALIPGYPDTKDAALSARSAVCWAERLPAKTPILILAGTADWRVDPRQALDMGQALLAARHPFRLVMLEGGQHDLSEHRAEVERLTREWLDRYVRDRKPWTGLEPHGE